MKILLLNGSPKKEKSDTLHITKAFLDGMNEIVPQEIHTVTVAEKHIEFCCGSLACMKNGGVCCRDDDMREILDEITSSDLLLFSFPLYCYSMPAKLKSLVDRMIPLSKINMDKAGERYVHTDQNDYSHLKFMMICGCGFPNSRQNFEPAVLQFKLMFPRNHTVITVPESPMFGVPEAAQVTVPRLELVRESGRQYAKSGKIDDELLSKITSPMIPEEVYASMVNGEA